MRKHFPKRCQELPFSRKKLTFWLYRKFKKTLLARLGVVHMISGTSEFEDRRANLQL